MAEVRRPCLLKDVIQCEFISDAGFRREKATSKIVRQQMLVLRRIPSGSRSLASKRRSRSKAVLFILLHIG